MLFPVTATPSHTNSHRSFHSTLRSALNFHQSLGFLFQGFWNAVCDIGFYTTYTSFFFRVSGTLSAISASTRPTRLSCSGFLERCLRYRLLHDLPLPAPPFQLLPRGAFVLRGRVFHHGHSCRLVCCCARLSFMSLCRLKS